MRVRACVFGFVVLMASPTGAGERLALKVSPAVAFAPANLIVRTTVEARLDTLRQGLPREVPCAS